ncbi:hypothetical protein C6I20_13540 [Aeromicrobium sp. A1-2]|uniref:hypothetical protein n=1 Tax=Aeromicrobium sp. A1-2 TaxID=2107713 RepID=UPI000E51B7E3|nr:hypothetical protein [Aeromicrobium sp. A1-2]AXT86108.1 hypothetical protein C6I20_13540 [Aeromicrobium sp. A1-2]
MDASNESPSTKPSVPGNRTVAAGIILLVAAVFVSRITQWWWARVFDGAIHALGDTPRAAALVGWGSIFPVFGYALMLMITKERRTGIFFWTWPFLWVAVFPLMTLQPSRPRRAESVRDDYWYLGSFFDTHFFAIYIGIVLVGVFVGGAWLRSKLDPTWEKPHPVLDRLPVVTLAAMLTGSLVWAVVGF